MFQLVDNLLLKCVGFDLEFLIFQNYYVGSPPLAVSAKLILTYRSFYRSMGQLLLSPIHKYQQFNDSNLKT